METAPLSALCSRISSGGTPSRKHPEYFSDDGGHLWVKSQELIDRPIFDTGEKISDLGLKNSSAKYFDEDTVLIAMYGATVGQLAVLKAPATFNQAICALSVDPEVADYRYVFYALMATRHDLTIQAAGAAQQNLNQALIRDFEIPVFTLETQRRIARILGGLDDLVENNRRRIEILGETARLIYQEWLVHFRFPGHEQVKLVDSDLGRIPEGWGVSAFSELADFTNGFAFKSSEHWLEEGLPIVKIKELKAGVTPDTPRYHGDDIKEDYFVNDGDVLFSWSADLDAYVWSGGPALLNQHLFVVRPHELSKVLIFHSLRARMAEFRARSQGTTMKHIKRSALSEVRSVIPDGTVRQQFEGAVGPVMALELNLRHQNRILREARDLLLPRLISGELDVSHLDLDLEPVA